MRISDWSSDVCSSDLQDCWEGQSTFWGGTGSLRSTPYYPVIIRGAWTNISCGKCGDGCSCDGTPALRLPGPIDSITNVIIDGVTLASDRKSTRLNSSH